MRKIRSLCVQRLVVMLFFTFVVAISNVQAQEMVQHIVERGETIESIAGKYGTTKDEIIRLNPDAGQFVYVGMSLTLPQGKNNSETTVNNKTNNEVVQSSIQNSSRNISSGSDDLFGLDKDNILLNVHYRALFNDAGHGSYMFEGYYFSDNDWGVNLGLGANYGIENSNAAGIQFVVGPSYCYQIDDTWQALASLDYYGNFHKVSELTAIENSKPKFENKMRLGWGISLSPRVVGMFDSVGFIGGLDFMWLKSDKKLHVGFSLGVVFKL